MFRSVFIFGIGFAFACIGALAPSIASEARLNITSTLSADPDVQGKLKEICRKIAAGNERKCWIGHAFLTLRPSATHSKFDAQIKLKSRHKPTSYIVLYDTTAKVNVKADIHNEICVIENVRVSASNEIYRVLLGLFRKTIVDAVKRAATIC